MERDRENRRYLPGVALPDGIRLSADVASAVAGASVVFLAVPSQQMRAASRNFAGTLRPGAVVVSCAKGFELESWLRMTEVIVDAGALAPERVCALSGPNLAREIAEGMPASAVVASVSAETAERVQRCVSSARFRVYTSDDPVGVEYGGALKNVIAIGAGAIDGMGLGQNAKAAFMTRGLAEITRSPSAASVGWVTSLQPARARCHAIGPSASRLAVGTPQPTPATRRSTS
jgi:glycerol-3-phosphate dehydrogenase (NAD(P)+)